MKTFDAGYAAHIATRNTTLAYGLKITRTDGEIFAFTSNDRDDPVTEQGSPAIYTLYRANPGLDVSSIVTAANMGVGNLELRTLHDGSVFTTEDLLAGVWRNASFTLIRYNYVTPANGVEYLLAGTIGENELRVTEVFAELRDLRDYLQHQIGAASSKTCRYRLGLNDGLHSHCPVRLDPPAWQATTPYTVRQPGDSGTGSVVKPTTENGRHFKCTTAGTSDGSEPTWNTTIGGTTNDGTVVWTAIQALTVTGQITHVTGNQEFRDENRTEDADFFAEGTFTFIAGSSPAVGNNIGRSQKVSEYAADGTFTLQLPMYGTVQVGDWYSVTAGCAKRINEDCIAKFDAVLDFGGEPHRPMLDDLTQDASVNV